MCEQGMQSGEVDNYINGNNKSPSWSGVEFLYNFLTTNKLAGPYGRKVSQDKIEIGDISIKSVVAKDYKIPRYNFKALQNISLNGVMTLSNIVAEGIVEVIKSY